MILGFDFWEGLCIMTFRFWEGLSIMIFFLKWIQSTVLQKTIWLLLLIFHIIIIISSANLHLKRKEIIKLSLMDRDANRRIHFGIFSVCLKWDWLSYMFVLSSKKKRIINIPCSYFKEINFKKNVDIFCNFVLDEQLLID